MSKIIKYPDNVRWNLKIALVEKRMMAQDLAKKIGCSRRYLSHVINGRYPGWPYRGKVVNVLGYSEKWLFKIGGGSILQQKNQNVLNRIARWIKLLFSGAGKIFQFVVRELS